MKKVFNIKKFILFILITLIICASILVGVYFYLCSGSGKGNSVNIYIEEGNSYSTISSLLKEKDIIKSELAYKIYIKLNPPKETLEYGEYALKDNYSVSELLSVLERGSISLADTVTITFYEGKNMRNVVSIISEKFGFDEKTIYSKLSDSSYLDTLIKDYWFLSDEIKNKDIYYPLEGYLFPDTYEFYASSDIDDIVRKLLDTFESKIEPYKESIENSKYSMHEILTLASIVEQEAGLSTDRQGVAGVFYNRLNSGWSLGSDVTTYYAEKKDDFSKDLTVSELNDCNAYNTRSSCMSGKLPVGPICNPSLDSIVAAINPTSHKYYYFVADKNGKTYFNETDSGHINTVNKLKRDGLWIDYD